MRTSLFSLHYAWEPCLWKQRVMGVDRRGGARGRTCAHTHAHVALRGHWPTPTELKILINSPSQKRENFNVAPLTYTGAKVKRKWGVEEAGGGGVAKGVTLSWRQSCTNRRTQMYTQTLLVVFKPAENCCSSVKSLPVFLLQGGKKMAPLKLSLLAAGDKSLSFSPHVQLSLQVSASRFCSNSPFSSGSWLVVC